MYLQIIYLYLIYNEKWFLHSREQIYLGFTQMALQDCISQCDPEELFRWNLVRLTMSHVGIIFIILGLSYVLSTLLCFSLHNSVCVFFSFWLDIHVTRLFLSSICVFHLFFFFFTEFFFHRYQFVELANCTICFFFFFFIPTEL